MIHVNTPHNTRAHALTMLESLAWLGPFCSLHGEGLHGGVLQGGLLLALCAAGAAGSVVHCGPMCGIFVLGQMSERMARLPRDRMCERERTAAGLLLPYHLGRLTTYGGLGALAAGSVGWFAGAGWFRTLSAVLLVIAALLFLSHAVRRIMPDGARFDPAPRWWGRQIGRWTYRIRRGSVFGEYLFGVALGFLPCGFLYAAITAAAASEGAATGAAAMIAFGLGTTPALMVVAIAGQAAGRRWNRGITAAAPILMVLNATLLLALAWQRVS